VTPKTPEAVEYNPYQAQAWLNLFHTIWHNPEQAPENNTYCLRGIISALHFQSLVCPGCNVVESLANVAGSYNVVLNYKAEDVTGIQ
jgi:hypothetical protein